MKGPVLIDHPEQLYEGYLVKKHHHTIVSKEASSHAVKPLQLVHTNVCGSITPTSLDKNKYFLNDNFSHKLHSLNYRKSNLSLLLFTCETE